MIARLAALFLSRQFLKFVAVGGTGFALNLGLTVALTEWLRIFYLAAYACAALASWTSMFLVHARFTFRGHGTKSMKKAYALFVAYYAALIGVNFTLVWLLTSVIGLWYVASIFFVTGALSLVSFLMNRLVIFRRSESGSERA